MFKINSKLSLDGATSKDILFIENLMIIDSNRGHYKKEFIENPLTLKQTINTLISGKQLNNNGMLVTPQTAIVKTGNINIGFIVIGSMPSGLIEFWYFSLDDKYKGKGFGTQVIDFLEKQYESLSKSQDSKPLFIARCSDNSNAMKKILIKKKYIKSTKSEPGWSTFINSKNSKFDKLLVDIL
jgi:hypothetical protein